MPTPSPESWPSFQSIRIDEGTIAQLAIDSQRPRRDFDLSSSRFAPEAFGDSQLVSRDTIRRKIAPEHDEQWASDCLDCGKLSLVFDEIRDKLALLEALRALGSQSWADQQPEFDQLSVQFSTLIEGVTHHAISSKCRDCAGWLDQYLSDEGRYRVLESDSRVASALCAFDRAFEALTAEDEAADELCDGSFLDEVDELDDLPDLLTDPQPPDMW